MMKFGYGFGAIGFGSVYYFMATYHVVFLTNCVGFNATIASTISSVALIIEAVAGMVVGNVSDRCNSKFGRRRPFILASTITILPIMFFVVRKIEAPVYVQIAYYLAFAILFRVFFSNCEIPYNALGADVVTDYDERTRLRTISRLFSIVGNAIGYIMPLVILELFVGREAAGWQLMGVILGLTALGSWGTSLFLVKEPARVTLMPKKKNVFKHIIVNYFELLKLKPMRLLLIYKIAFSVAFAINNVGTIYFLKYNLGLDNRYSSYIYVFTIIIFTLSTPLVDKMAMIKSKAWQQMVSMGICGFAGIGIYLFAADSVLFCAVYVGLMALVTTGFWQLSGSLFYDIVEVDEFANNKRREGDIMSFVSIVGTIMTALVVQGFGVLFNMAGFDANASVQSESVMMFLNAAFILVPSLCLLAGAYALKIFPIDRENFAVLGKVLALRADGLDYSMYKGEIEKIIGRD